jgi:hypothetical protein
VIGNDGAAVAHEVEAASDDARSLHLGAMELAEMAERGLKGTLVSRSRAGQRKRGKQKGGSEPMRHLT